MVFLNWDLLENITKPFVGECIEAGCCSCRDLNEIKKSQVKLSKAQRHLVTFAPLVKFIFEVNTKAKIHIKTDTAANQFPRT